MEKLFIMCKFHSRNYLGKHIDGILLCVNLLWLNVTFIKNLPNKVKPDVNVLRPFMIYLVLCQVMALMLSQLIFDRS